MRDIEPSEPEQVPNWLADLDDQSSITGGAAGDFGKKVICMEYIKYLLCVTYAATFEGV